ncbi:flagellar motor protein MotB [Microbacterium sp. YJN-G]|uniref:OmpA/MotB family protein n=1 Tax=Microbacterium sp. YJN-G TaxID=2763257 RepID=UPI00187789CD|nr:flagellar motor protein MotB [Microbacterium sp. YJN-G]
MSIRRRRRVEPEGHSGPDERWMASYLDMVTVLMCMFIVLFAMSSVDQQKFDALRSSLATGFGQEESERIDVSEGVIVPAELVDEDGEAFADVELSAAQKEFDNLSALRERLRTALEQNGLGDKATFTIDARGLTVSLVSAETFFATNSTALSDVAVRIIDALGAVLVTVPNEISVEGHADNRQSAAPFATNWELSSARATQVLRRLVEADGINPAAIKSVGFGDARPIAEGRSKEALAKNRRVDVVILSDAEEEVRQLLPGLQASSPVR